MKHLSEHIIERAFEKAEAFQEEAFALSDFMAKNPETGSQEKNSSAAFVRILKEHGIETEYPYAGLETAFIGRINPDRPDRIALLAEYDALREIGHACGHCASGSASLLAAVSLNEAREDLSFGVDIIGTPDEELLGGKVLMCERGVFDKYDAAMMVHMGGGNYTEVNFIALDPMLIRFYGKSAHAAQAPQEGINAMNAARIFLDATDMMRQHIIPEARIHGCIISGGTAGNVVPDFAEIEFYARAPKRKDLDQITAWVLDCVRAAELATKCKAEVEKYPSFDELTIEPGQKAFMERCFQEIGITDIESGCGMTGSSDIGNVSRRCPVFHPIISIGENLPCHTTEFAACMTSEKTHDAVRNAARLLIKMAVEYETEAECRERRRRERTSE